MYCYFFIMILVLFTVCYGLVPLLLFFLWKKKFSSEAKSFFPFTLLVFIASLYELIGSIFLRISVKYWFTVYNILIFTVVFHLFYKILKQKYKMLFVLFLMLFIFICIYISLNYAFEDVLEFNPYFKGFQTLFILTFSILWFRNLFSEMISKTLLNEPVFYLISGLILYYCGTFFLFLLGNVMYLNDEDSFHDSWIINVVLNIILRTLLILTLWKTRLK